jgi:hypothetical protein
MVVTNGPTGLAHQVKEEGSIILVIVSVSLSSPKHLQRRKMHQQGKGQGEMRIAMTVALGDYIAVILC